MRANRINIGANLAAMGASVELMGETGVSFDRPASFRALVHAPR